MDGSRRKINLGGEKKGERRRGKKNNRAVSQRVELAALTGGRVEMGQGAHGGELCPAAAAWSNAEGGSRNRASQLGCRTIALPSLRFLCIGGLVNGAGGKMAMAQ
jgi:hypothetical protein